MRALWLIGVLVFILLLGGVSFISAIASIVGSDSCGGCDRDVPLWAWIGWYGALVLLVLWLAYVIALAVRRIAAGRRSG